MYIKLDETFIYPMRGLRYPSIDDETGNLGKTL